MTPLHIAFTTACQKNTTIEKNFTNDFSVSSTYVEVLGVFNCLLLFPLLWKS